MRCSDQILHSHFVSVFFLRKLTMIGDSVVQYAVRVVEGEVVVGVAVPGCPCLALEEKRKGNHLCR